MGREGVLGGDLGEEGGGPGRGEGLLGGGWRGPGTRRECMLMGRGILFPLQDCPPGACLVLHGHPCTLMTSTS